MTLLESDRSVWYAPAHARWEQLAAAVRAYDPTVVVLVARKAPRVAQALGLSFGHRPLQISDLGIQLSAQQLEGARVAIVDDVINVGSTVVRARDNVRAAGASDVRIFALARRDAAVAMVGPEDAHIVDERSLDESGVAALAVEIPLLLHAVAGPYDLDFPLIRCRLPLSDEPFATLMAAMVERYGDDAVYDLTVPAGASEGVRRLTVDLPNGETAHQKVRLFVDENARTCAVVPISLSAPLPTTAPEAEWARSIWDALGVDGCHEEARARARIFLDSLLVGTTFVCRERDLLSPVGRDPFDVDEATLILGPRATLAAAAATVQPGAVIGVGSEVAATSPSPFYAAAVEKGLVADVRNRMAPATDELSAFITFFATLAEWVGSGDPDEYRLGWPYSAQEIADDPYLRLRIGPSFGDLVALLGDLAPGVPAAQLRAVTSRLLDRYVDDGGIVPTTARYGDALFRIYRKGEKDPRDHVSLRLRRAWTHYGKPLSLTRATKIATILSFSEDHGHSDVSVQTITRGNVLCYAPTVLHDEAEVTHHLLRTGQLEPVD